MKQIRDIDNEKVAKRIKKNVLRINDILPKDQLQLILQYSLADFPIVQTSTKAEKYIHLSSVCKLWRELMVTRLSNANQSFDIFFCQKRIGPLFPTLMNGLKELDLRFWINGLLSYSSILDVGQKVTMVGQTQKKYLTALFQNKVLSKLCIAVADDGGPNTSDIEYQNFFFLQMQIMNHVFCNSSLLHLVCLELNVKFCDDNRALEWMNFNLSSLDQLSIFKVRFTYSFIASNIDSQSDCICSISQCFSLPNKIKKLVFDARMPSLIDLEFFPQLEFLDCYSSVVINFVKAPLLQTFVFRGLCLENSPHEWADLKFKKKKLICNQRDLVRYQHANHLTHLSIINASNWMFGDIVLPYCTSIHAGAEVSKPNTFGPVRAFEYCKLNTRTAFEKMIANGNVTSFSYQIDPMLFVATTRVEKLLSCLPCSLKRLILKRRNDDYASMPMAPRSLETLKGIITIKFPQLQYCLLKFANTIF